MKIDRSAVESLAHLARLSLTEDELSSMEGDLASILNFMEQLNQVNTDEIPETAHIQSQVNVTRPDEVAPSYDREEILSNAPCKKDDSFVVPRIIKSS